MTRAEMLSRISSQEITEWMAYYLVEPFGQTIEQYGHAITASTIANVNRQKGSKAAKAADFIPKLNKKEKTTDELIQFAAMTTIGLGGQDLRQEE